MFMQTLEEPDLQKTDLMRLISREKYTFTF